MTNLCKRNIFFTVILFITVQFIQAEEEADKKKAYSSSTGLSLLMTSGNTQELSFGFDTEQNLDLNKHQIQFKGSMIYTQSDGSKESEQYYSHLEYRRDLSSKAYLVGSGRLERNVLSGYKYRLALSGGAGYRWTTSKKMELSSELAVGWSNENNIEKDKEGDVTLSFVSCLISSKLKILLSANSEMIYHEMFFLNLDDTEDYRLSSLASLSVSISRYLALKISYQLKYNHRPVLGFKSTDHFLLSSLVLNF
jgi:putative salt-induced outer membrane protein